MTTIKMTPALSAALIKLRDIDAEWIPPVRHGERGFMARDLRRRCREKEDAKAEAVEALCEIFRVEDRFVKGVADIVVNNLRRRREG